MSLGGKKEMSAQQSAPGDSFMLYMLHGESVQVQETKSVLKFKRTTYRQQGW